MGQSEGGFGVADSIEGGGLIDLPLFPSLLGQAGGSASW